MAGFSQESSHETHLSTFSGSPQAYPRLSGPHEDPRRPGCHPRSARQRPQAPGRLTGTAASPVARNDAGRSGRSHRLAGEHFILAARVATEPDSPRLTMAIPRKLVPSSPVRNLMRRVIREAHRHASVSHPQAFSSDGHWALRFQLVKVPTDAVAPTRDPSGRVLKPFARRPTDRLLKQRIRAEADALLHRLLARVSSSVAATPS